MQLILALIFIAVTATQAIAFGTPDYKPDGAHPRIWLNSSLIITFKAKKAANTTEWQNLLTRSGVFVSYINNQPYRLDWPGAAGYAGSGYQDAIMTWGILYYTYKTPAYGTGSETADDVTARTYAQYAVNLVTAMVGYYSSGEESDGIDLVRMNDRLYMFNTDEKNINAALTGTADKTYRAGQTRLLTYKNGYAARTSATALPLFYDWFHDDPLFTSQLKTTLYKIMYRHIDWYRGVRSTYNNGVLISGTRYHEDKDGDCTGINNCNINDTSDHLARRQKGYAYGWSGANFYGGFTGMALLDAVAVYGDPPQADADAYLTFAKSLWTSTKAQMDSATGYKGGDSPEGIYYGSNWDSVLAGGLGFQTATGQDLFTGFDFPKDHAANLLHNNFSELNRIVHRGAWSSIQSAQWMTPIIRGWYPTAYILRNLYGEPAEAKALQQYMNTATFADKGAAWEQFMWKSDTASTQAVNTLPLYFKAAGTGVMTMRSSWDGSTSPVLAQVSLKGTQRQDHESFDNGGLTISRGADRLLSRLKKTDITDEENAVGQNTIVFNAANSFNSMTADVDHIDPLASPALDREQHAAAFDYVSGEVGNAWRSTTATPLAKYFRRSVLFLRPNRFVVYDVTRSNSTVGNAKDLYLQLEAVPSINAQSLSATVGTSKLFATVLYPSGNYTDSDISAQSHASVATVFHRVKFSPSTQTEYAQFLHVLEASDSGATQTATTAITGTGGRGALIADPTENKVVMFTADQGGANITSLTYSVDTSASSRHYIADLAPNTNYAVSIDGGAAVTYTASSAGVIEFVNLVHSPHSYSVTQTGTAPPPTVTTTRVFNGRLSGRLH